MKTDYDNEYTYFEYLLFRWVMFIGSIEGYMRKFWALIVKGWNSIKTFFKGLKSFIVFIWNIDDFFRY